MKIAKNKTTLVRFGLIVNNVIGLTLTFYSIRRWSSPALGLVIIFCVSCVVNVFIGGFGLALNQRTTAFIKDANLSGSIVALLDAVLAIAFLALHIVSVSIADSSWQVRSTAMLMYGAFLGLVACLLHSGLSIVSIYAFLKTWSDSSVTCPNCNHNFRRLQEISAKGKEASPVDSFKSANEEGMDEGDRLIMPAADE